MLGGDFIGYFAISLVALGADFLLFVALTYATELRPGLAAAAGWSLGLSVHYLLARHFLYRAMPQGGTLWQAIARFIVYAGPSVAGLVLTIIVVEVAAWLGLAQPLAKVIAAVLSFQLAFLLRSLMFGRSAEPSKPELASA